MRNNLNKIKNIYIYKNYLLFYINLKLIINLNNIYIYKNNNKQN